MQAEKIDSTDFVVADNIIDAVNEIDIISLNVLLAEGAKVDTVDELGNTPLMLAAKIGNPRMLKIILAHKPNVDRRNEDGNTALMIASEAGVQPVIEELIAHGADTTLKNSKGMSPSEIAKRNGHASIAKILHSKAPVSFSR